MPLQPSGEIKFSQLAAEFGDSPPYNFSDFLKGGSYVPNNGSNTNVPSSGQIRLSNFYSSVGSGANYWQLPAGHYVPQKLAPELIFPRPDAETPVWAKHRRHYPGIPYEIPIGVAFGSWPFFFEIVTAPAGATIGAFLQASGDKLIVPEDYGVVSWDNPTVGTHSFHIRVNFQDGTTPLNVQWTLQVTTTGTIFLDAINGNDANDGSLNSPLQTIDGWYKLSYTDRTYTGYQVCYKTGTYDVESADVASANIRMEYLNKPLVHYAYPGDSPVWNFDNGTMNFAVISAAETNGFGEYHMSDWYMGGITCTGGQQAYSSRRWALFAGARGPFVYDGTGGGQRCTWYKCPQINWNYTGDPANNAGICFGSDVNDVTKRRNYWLLDRITFNNITSSGYSTTNFNGWYIGNISLALFQNSELIGTNFGRSGFTGKSSQWKTCYRNIDQAQAPNQQIEIDTAGEYAPLIGGYNEISYCKANYQVVGAGQFLILFNHHFYTFDPLEPYMNECWEYRNSFSKAPSATGEIFRAATDWPVTVEKDVWCSSGDGIYLNAPSNSQVSGDWQLYSIANNPFDANMNLTGTARTNLLGTHGAEVAFP